MSAFDSITLTEKKPEIKPSDVSEEQAQRTLDSEDEIIKEPIKSSEEERLKSSPSVKVINQLDLTEIKDVLTEVSSNLKQSTIVNENTTRELRFLSEVVEKGFKDSYSLHAEKQENKKNQVKPRNYTKYFIVLILIFVITNIIFSYYIYEQSSKVKNRLKYNKIILGLENRINELEENQNRAHQ